MPVVGNLGIVSQFSIPFSNTQFVLFLQGLVHLGKGTLTIGPFHCDRTLMSPVAVGGLLSVLVAGLDMKNSKMQLKYFYLFIKYTIENRFVSMKDTKKIQIKNEIQNSFCLEETVDIIFNLFCF